MSLLKSGLPVTVCAPETTQLFDPGRHASQSRSISCAALEWRVLRAESRSLLVCSCDVCWSALGVSGSGTESVAAPSSAALAGGRSRQELAGYKSTISSGDSRAATFSREYSIPYCWFNSSLMLSPTSTESPTVQGLGA